MGKIDFFLSNGKTIPYCPPCKTVVYLIDSNGYSSYMLAIIEIYKKSILIKPTFNPHSLLYPSIPIQIFKFIAPPPSNRIKSIIYATICLAKFTL